MPGHPARNVAVTRPVGLTVPTAKLTFRWWVGAAWQIWRVDLPLRCTQPRNNEWSPISPRWQKSVRSEL